MRLRLVGIALLCVLMTVNSALAFGIYPLAKAELAMGKNASASIVVMLKNDAIPKTVTFFASGKGLKWNGQQDQFRTNLSFGLYEQMNVTVAIVSAGDMTVNAVYGVVEGQGMFQTTTSDALKVVVGSGNGTVPVSNGTGGSSSSSGGGGGGGGNYYPTTTNYSTACNGTYKLVGNIWICIPKGANVSANVSVPVVPVMANNTAPVVPAVVTSGGNPSPPSSGEQQVVMQDVSQSEGGIAKATTGGVVETAVKGVVDTVVRAVKTGPMLGLVAVVCGLLTLVLQGASYVVVRRSDAV